MNAKMNYYELLGIKREELEFVYKKDSEGLIDIGKREKRSTHSKNQFIKKVYEQRHAFIKRLRDKSTNSRNIDEIDKTIERLNRAFEVLGKESSRELYNMELDKKNRKKNRPYIEETAYDFFDISEEDLKNTSPEKLDIKLKKIRDSKIEKYKKILNISNITFSEKKKIELLILKVDEYYTQIDTLEKREKYNIFLDEKEQEEVQKIYQKQIKNKYSHISEYNPELIDTLKNEEEKQRKAIEKKEIDKSPIIYLYDDRNIRLRKISEIIFRNFTGVSTSYINGYEVARDVNGQEIKNIIYTNLSLPELAIDEEKEQPINKQYYDCVVKKLLAEDTIEGSKYNSGYIGMVERNDNGDYDITLGKEKLNLLEQEMLTAVIIINQSEKVKLEGKEK